MNFINDPNDEEYREYIKNMGISEKYDEDDNKEDNCSCTDDSSIYASCNLKVDFDTKNKIIYLCPGKFQYFTADVLKCCGDVTIKYIGNCKEDKICGNLGIYKIVKSGILVETYYKLDKRKKDILNFVAVDNCTGECYEFAAIFSCNHCCYC